MRIKIRLFAILRDRAGKSDLTLDLPQGSTIEGAISEIGERLPAIGDLLPSVAFAVNQEYVKIHTALQDGDELALIPAVSGG